MRGSVDVHVREAEATRTRRVSVSTALCIVNIDTAFHPRCYNHIHHAPG